MRVAGKRYPWYKFAGGHSLNERRSHGGRRSANLLGNPLDQRAPSSLGIYATHFNSEGADSALRVR